MTAGRISVEGDTIEIAGRFTKEAEIDAFIERVWTVFFAVHPPAEEAESVEAPINQPPLGSARALREVFAEQASANIPTPSRPAVMAGPAPTTAEDAIAFARLAASERRAVLLMRKHGDRNIVAKEMEINPNSVTNLLGYARRKGVQI